MDIIKINDLPRPEEDDKVSEAYPTLINFLKHCIIKYYDGNPIISDSEYDALLDMAEIYEQRYPTLIIWDSPTRTVGTDKHNLRDDETIYQHPTMMQSLDKVKCIEDLQGWIDTTITKLIKFGIKEDDITFLIEPKYDGLATRLIYEDGRLTHFVLRGTGYEGTDLISRYKRPIPSIPLTIDSNIQYLDVAGELVITNKNFKELNDFIEQKTGKVKYPTPRHAVSALVNLRSWYHLTFIAHSVNTIKDQNGVLHTDSLGDSLWLDRFTTMVTPSGKRMQVAGSIAREIIPVEVLKRNKQNHEEDIQTDGLVIKINNKHQKTLLGATIKYPRWVIAYKYLTKIVTTVLKDVTWQIGKKGSFTPVAELEPAVIDNVTITRASLFNMDHIKRLDLNINDTVLLTRANEVIPYIIGPIPDLRVGKDISPIRAPDTCPYCQTALVAEEKSLICPNKYCPEKVIMLLMHCTSRAVFNLKFIGEKIVRGLYETKLVTRPEHFFQLSRELLEKVMNCNEKQIKLILSAIFRARKRLNPVTMVLSLGLNNLNKVELDDFFMNRSIKDLTHENLSTCKPTNTITTLAESLDDPDVKDTLRYYASMYS